MAAARGGITIAMSGTDLEYLPRLPRNKSIGIGCIGAGFIMADCHLVAYRAAGFNPVAIAARKRDRATVVAARHGIPSVCEDYRELLERQVKPNEKHADGTD